MRVDLDAVLDVPDPAWLGHAEVRRELTRTDPLAFALIYLSHHLRSMSGEITLSRFHMDLIDRARGWAGRGTAPRGPREAFIAPRESGKSTWCFLVLPMWLAAHEHSKFIAAFADSSGQAEMHLQSFKNELDNNELLRHDYPRLCQPSRRAVGTSESDTKSMYIARNGFVFGAKGMDAKSLGMKVGARRPDLILLDDIEPPASNYSPDLKSKRLASLQNAILPLSVTARVVLVGTVTMPGSIVHDLIRTITEPNEPPEEWVRDEGFVTHHYRALVSNEDGEPESIWPEKWTTEFLVSISHTRSFALNYDNDPLAADGQYWNSDDIGYGLPVDEHGKPVPLTHHLISVDPAVTDRSTSDYTGIAVVSGNRRHRRAVVRYATQIKVQPGEPLRRHVLRLLDAYPEVSVVLVESNQAGDAWYGILHNLPVKLATVHNTEPKRERAATLLNHYQRGRVTHERRLPAAETQLVGFPKGHDDIVDAIGNGVAAVIGETGNTGNRDTVSSYAA